MEWERLAVLYAHICMRLPWGSSFLIGTWHRLCTCMPSQFSSVQSLSCVRLFATPWIAARQASLSITNSRSSLRLTSIESVMPSSHLILGRSLLLLPPIPPSIRVFSNESTLCMRWPKYWSFNFSIIPSKEIPGLISFRMDWLALLAVQGTLKSLLQHHSSKASILRRSALPSRPCKQRHPSFFVGSLQTFNHRNYRFFTLYTSIRENPRLFLTASRSWKFFKSKRKIFSPTLLSPPLIPVEK